MLRDGCPIPFSRSPLGEWEKVPEGRMRESPRHPAYLTCLGFSGAASSGFSGHLCLG